MRKTYTELQEDCKHANSRLNNYNFALPQRVAAAMIKSPVFVEVVHYKQVCDKYERITGKKIYVEISTKGVYFYELEA